MIDKAPSEAVRGHGLFSDDVNRIVSYCNQIDILNVKHNRLGSVGLTDRPCMTVKIMTCINITQIATTADDVKARLKRTYARTLLNRSPLIQLQPGEIQFLASCLVSESNQFSALRSDMKMLFQDLGSDARYQLHTTVDQPRQPP